MGKFSFLLANVFACSLRNRMLKSTVCAAGELRAYFIPNPAMQHVVYIPKRETEGTIFLPVHRHFISSACSQLPLIVDNSRKSLENPKLFCSLIHLLWVIYTERNGHRCWLQKREWMHLHEACVAISVAKDLKAVCRTDKALRSVKIRI